jgi:hypothetical protein
MWGSVRALILSPNVHADPAAIAQLTPHALVDLGGFLPEIESMELIFGDGVNLPED